MPVGGANCAASITVPAVGASVVVKLSGEYFVIQKYTSKIHRSKQTNKHSPIHPPPHPSTPQNRGSLEESIHDKTAGRHEIFLETTLCWNSHKASF